MEDYTIINENIKIDNKKALTKWSPILDVLSIEDKDLRLFTAVYAEYYQLRLNKASNGTFSDIEQNLLPLNLKIISKLNLSGKTYEFKENIDEVRMNVILSRCDII